MKKQIRFDMLAAGEKFTNVVINDGDDGTTEFVKLSTRTAAPGGYADRRFNIKPSTLVTVEVPDPPQPTAEEVYERRVQRFFRKLERMRATSSIEKFQKNLAENPRYAFSWSESAFEEAVRRDVALRVEAVFDHVNEATGVKVTLDETIAYCLQNALMMAQRTSQSTSVMSNMETRFEAAALAYLADEGSF